MIADIDCQLPSLPTGGKTMSISKAYLGNLSRLVEENVRIVGVVDIRQIMLIELVAEHIEYCRKLRISEPDILVAIARAREKIIERGWNEQKKAS